ncbi:MAG: hypothetical protein N3A38_04760 [Planctomycetota bacterium]|nr:hypothetical protein [Planctomycetota bacterium]
MRHLALLVSFLFWCLMMGLLYREHIRPGVPEEAAGSELEALFAGFDAPPPMLRTIWLGEPKEGGGESPLGAIETRFIRVGESEMQIHDRAVGSLPRSVAMLLPGASDISYLCVSRISRARGILDLDASFSGLGREVRIHGVRKGDYLEVEYSVSGGGSGERTGRDVYPLDPRASAGAGFSPFRRMPRIEEGMEWRVILVDPSKADTGRPVETVAKVTGRKAITVGGRRIEAWEVSCLDGKAKAWYSPDGNLLRESWLLFGAVPVTIQHEDPSKASKYFGSYRAITRRRRPVAK